MSKMSKMKKLEKLQIMARLLKEHRAYVKCKKSTCTNRFDFKFNEEDQVIKIFFNSKKGANIRIWPEFVMLASWMSLELSYCVFEEDTDLKVIFIIC